MTPVKLAENVVGILGAAFAAYLVVAGILMIVGAAVLWHDRFAVPPPKCFHGSSAQGVAIPSDRCAR